MTRFHNRGGTRVQFTAEEETARDAEEKTFNDAAPARRMAKLRQERDWLLQKTDYMALGDVTMTDVWKTYRQALRDITDTYSSMSDDGFAFPTKPS